MISNGMAARISAQLNRELYSAYFYLGLSAQAETMNLKGTAAWFMAKHAEERFAAALFVGGSERRSDSTSPNCRPALISSASLSRKPLIAMLTLLLGTIR